MDSSTWAAILFAVSAVVAAIAAFREDILAKVNKLALAVSIAAAGLFVVFSDLIHNGH